MKDQWQVMSAPMPQAKTVRRRRNRSAMFSVQIRPSDGQRIWQFWVETSYSRFPESDVNEEIDFLPLNWLPTDGWRDRILALSEGRQIIAGTTWWTAGPDLYGARVNSAESVPIQSARSGQAMECPLPNG